MTENGRGQGSEPWHPEDPLYGDGGWEGQQQAHAGQQAAYGGQPQHYPEQQPQQPQHYGDWGNGQQASYGQAQQYQQQGQHYPQQGQQYPQQGQQYPQQGQQYDQQQYPGHGQQAYDNNGWATGSQPQVQYPDPADPYGQQTASYGGDQHDYYGTPDAYPPPEPPSRRQAEPEPPETDWDPGPDQGEHAFFAGGDDKDDDDFDDESGGGRGRGDRRGGRGGGKPKKRRSGMACLVVVLVFGAGVAGVGYFGYQFYQDRFGDAPDFAGDGTNETVTVEIPKGAFGSDIGQKLKAAGVVKSVDAFVSAQQENPHGDRIQAGAYLLKKQMSAESAVEMMLSPESQNNVLVRPGERNSAVYKAIDAQLELSAGATEKVAEKKYKSLGLPSWANDNGDIKDPLEGFLLPGTYPAAKGMKPESVLKAMVTQANEKYSSYGISAKAKSLKLDSPLQLITVASLVQAEGKYKHDFEKIATVVYNRLKPNNTETYGLLDFDSTVNYAKDESTLETGAVDDLRQFDDPYNTYKFKGLPPGPIGNPGVEAINATLKPAKGNWYYFVSINADKTLFAETNQEHEKNRRLYEQEQSKNSAQ